jgi:TRAP-type C4-dicarboxylate transport system permease small subunit
MTQTRETTRALGVRPAPLPLTSALRAAAHAIAFAYRLTATVLLAGGAIAQVVLIVTRNLADLQPAWSTTAATAALATGGVLYIGLCPSHITFRFVRDQLRRLDPRLAAVPNLIAAVIAAALLYYGAKAVGDQRRLGVTFQSLNVPMWVPLLSVPLASAALLIRFLSAAWRELLGGER